MIEGYGQQLYSREEDRRPLNLPLPCVRFVRCYDPFKMQIVNTLMKVTTKDQLDNWPRATECTVTEVTVEKALAVISQWHWLDAETFKKIKEASHLLLDAKDSVYEAR